MIIINRTSAPFPGIRICRMRRQRTNIFPDSSGMTGAFRPPPMASRGMYRAMPLEEGRQSNPSRWLRALTIITDALAKNQNY